MNSRHGPLWGSLLLLVSLVPITAGAATEAPNRLVSTDAGATELLLALNAGERLVGVDDSSLLPQSLELPRLGYHRALSAEGLVALDPDLVVGSTHMGPPHVLDALTRSAIPLLQMEPPMTLAQLRSNVLLLATAVDSPAAEPLLARLDAARASLEPAPSTRQLTAAFLLRAEGGKLRMAGKDTAGAAMVTLLGAQNLADYDGYRSLNGEALLTLQPDLLLFADTGNASAADVLETLPLLRFSKAVKGERLFMVDAGSLVAGLSLAALEEARRIRAVMATQP